MKEKVDIGHIPHHQREMHDRLVNWAMWAKPGQSASICPMFRAMRYKSNSRQWHDCDEIAAQFMEKEVCKLPDNHRKAIVWFYVYCTGALKMQRKLGVNVEGLNRLVVDGRQMLMNRD